MRNPLQEFRKELKLSQSDLAKALCVTPQLISAIESGSRSLTDRMIHNIANEFGVSEEWLRTGEGDMYALPDEDENMIEMFARLSADEIEPWQRKTVSALAEFILNLPADALPAFQKLLTDLGNAPEFNKKDES